MIEKQYGELKKECSEIKTSIKNQTRQQGILQNLVLDLKNSDGGSEEAKAESESPERSKECKIEKVIVKTFYCRNHTQKSHNS